MEDEVILAENSAGITISKTMARFGNVSYPIASIGAVSISKEKSMLVRLGVIVGIVGVALLFGSNREVALPWLVAGIALIVLGIALVKTTLMLRTASGNQQAYGSRDKEFVQQLKAAIETAVARRG